MFPYIKPLLKSSYLKRKEFTQKGSKLFAFIADSFSDGGGGINNNDRAASLENVSVPPKEQFEQGLCYLLRSVGWKIYGKESTLYLLWNVLFHHTSCRKSSIFTTTDSDKHDRKDYQYYICVLL